MVDVDSDVVWTTEFTITQTDLDWLEAFIDNNGRAQHLSTLAKQVVKGRLRYGHEQSTSVSQLFGSDTSVKQWDPAREWQIGDHVIVLRKLANRLVAYIGEVQSVDLIKNIVDVFIPEENLVNRYGLMSASDSRRQKIVNNVKKVIARRREEVASRSTDDDREEMLDIIVLEHGEHVAGSLLQALRKDERFILLDGRYFLGSLAVSPPESQLYEVAWSLLGESDPLSTNDLIDRISDTDGDKELFGLYLVLRLHPEWFANTQPGKRPLWVLAGPPPGSFTPQYPAYDPDSYEILCHPGSESAPDVVTRLWETELLTAVV